VRTIERREATRRSCGCVPQPVNEPFSVLVELTSSSGRGVREYTILLDLPR
jgi:hypothetical protein